MAETLRPVLRRVLERRALVVEAVRRNALAAEGDLAAALAAHDQVVALGLAIDFLDVVRARGLFPESVLVAVEALAAESGPAEAAPESLPAGVSIEDHLHLGRLLVRNRLLTREALEECLGLQRQVQSLGLQKPLGEILVDRGLLRADLLPELLALQAYLRDPSAPAARGAPAFDEDDLLFGNIAIANGLADSATVQRALRLQQDVRAKLGLQQSLGEILYGLRAMPVEDIDRVLKLQQVRRKRAGLLPAVVRVSEDDEHRLGAVLEQNKLASPEALAKARQVQQELQTLGLCRRIGELLVLLGHLDEVELRVALDLQASRRKRREELQRVAEVKAARQRRRRKFALAGAAAFLLVAGAVYLAIQSGQGRLQESLARAPLAGSVDGAAPGSAPSEVAASKERADGGNALPPVGGRAAPEETARPEGQEAQRKRASPGVDILGETRPRDAGLRKSGGETPRGGELPAALPWVKGLILAASLHLPLSCRDGGDGTAQVVALGPEVVSLRRGGVESKTPWEDLPLPALQALLRAVDAGQADPAAAASHFHELGLTFERDAALARWLKAEPQARAEALALLGDGPFVFHQGAFKHPDQVAHLDAGDVRWSEGWVDPRVAARKLEAARQGQEKRILGQDYRAWREELAQRWRDLGVQDVQTVVWKGDVSRRIDIVLIADGYTAAQLPRFAQTVKNVARQLLQKDPYSNYAEHINIHRIDAVSPRPGAPRGAEDWTTPLDSRVGSGNILTCNPRLARAAAALAPDADLVVALVNVKGVRATGGGGVITLDASGDIDATFLHELGHAFGGLDDEYVDDTPAVQDSHPTWGPSDEAEHLNTTREADPRRAKWHYWNWPKRRGGVGCFEGAYYRGKGYFRPERDCLMRHHDRPVGYCAVCLEQMQRRFNACLDPIEAHLPVEPVLYLFAGDAPRFAVRTTHPGNQGGLEVSADVAWYLDGMPREGGKRAGDEARLQLEPGELRPGVHTLALRVNLLNNRIRRDRALLSSARVWRLEVHAGARPRLALPEKALALPWGDALELAVPLSVGEGDEPPTGFAARLEGAPAGMTLDAARALIRWVPRWDQVGRHTVRLVYADGPHQVAAALTIRVKGQGAQAGDRPPVIEPIAAPWCPEGGRMDFELRALHPAGEACVIEAEKLPEGAAYDPLTGRFAWAPRFDQAGQYEVEFVARDSGSLTDRWKLDLLVVETPSQDQPDPSDAGIFRALRSDDADYQRLALKALRARPSALRLMGATQLLRAADARVVGEATKAVEEVLERSEEGEEAPSPTELATRTVEGAAPATGVLRRRALMRVFLRDVANHVRDLADRPEVLAMIRRQCKSYVEGRQLTDSEREILGHVESELKAVVDYQRERGAGAAGGGD